MKTGGFPELFNQLDLPVSEPYYKVSSRRFQR